MTSVHLSLRRLEQLNEACGGVNTNNKNNNNNNNNNNGTIGEEEVDTSRMSAYDKGQYRIACCIKRARENITFMEESGDSLNITRRAEISNSIRRDINNMKKDATALHRLAIKEGRREDYNQLMIHINKTEQLQRARITGGNNNNNNMMMIGDILGNINSEQTHNTTGATLFTDMNNSGNTNNTQAPLISARDDEEFKLFFEQTKANDAEMDQALDRIGAGLSRLNDNALSLQSELETQQRLLDDTEVKVDNVQEKLTSINVRLRRTLKQVDKDKMAMYIFCCILLLGIVGAIYFMAT